MSTPDHVKVKFDLPVDDDGWPPADVEGMWAVPVGRDRYRIDNIPSYARGISDGDVVVAVNDADGMLVFQSLDTMSSFSTIRIAITDPDDKQAARDEFLAIGCESEEMNGNLFALSIPTERLDDAMKLIHAGEAIGRWDWEEGAIRA